MDLGTFIEKFGSLIGSVIVAIITVTITFTKIQNHNSETENKLNNYEENHKLIHEGLNQRLLSAEGEIKLLNPVLLEIQKDIAVIKTKLELYFDKK
jgi:hypothetical protein